MKNLDIRCYYSYPSKKDFNYMLNIIEGSFFNHLNVYEKDLSFAGETYIEFIPSNMEEKFAVVEGVSIIKIPTDFDVYEKLLTNEKPEFVLTLLISTFVKLCSKQLFLLKNCESIHKAYKETILNKFAWKGTLVSFSNNIQKKEVQVDYLHKDEIVIILKIRKEGLLIFEKEIFSILPSGYFLSQIKDADFTWLNKDSLQIQFKNYSKFQILVEVKNDSVNFIEPTPIWIVLNRHKQ